MQDALFDRNAKNRIIQFSLGNDISGNINYIDNSHIVPRPMRPSHFRRFGVHKPLQVKAALKS
jgi:hypothetical protein